MIEKANLNELAEIMSVIENARAFLKTQGIQQWQTSAYPATSDIQADIEKGVGFVLKLDGQVAAYAAVITGYDTAYDAIKGSWLRDSHDYVTIHRMAVSTQFRGQSLGQQFFTDIFKAFEGYKDFRVDTHPDNKIMQHILGKLGFEKCGIVMFEGERWAFQKIS